jgi:hypothetical protein
MGGAMTAGLGHNQGPTFDPGQSWRAHCWARARSDLLPRLPIEVVRLRVKRAKEIGLDYKTYASVRATTGHDIVAFLFSTNALRLLRDSDRMIEADARKLADTQKLGKLLAVQPPLECARVARQLAGQDVLIDATMAAPGLNKSWRETRKVLVDFLQDTCHSPDRVLLIGDTPIEREWVGAARLAGFVSAATYFPGDMSTQRL